ncbi:phosphonopyruvate decarboxylase [Clostridium aminobutyricum]|uniref:Phosphonopyruvate decarboxylase n=1 Tax=Clostridium aminobutyricum TaxID=33953 RepID=A0A939D9Q1_CLOAM|nr:phosphonopyruvate decarboxylase [Clostridium aminobutyricum]MBN7773751.1 phosphonopyruvate decarboxylase [Clostridium aminobutyricum]
MDVNKLIDMIDESTFFTGVPDSQLKALCDYLHEKHGISSQHIIAANEGNAVALATGFHLATGKTPVIYMQNSGIGNAINPIASLTSTDVYAIPCIFIIGWRGEPGVKDEPQHINQGNITLELLNVLNIETMVIDKETAINQIKEKMNSFEKLLEKGQSVAFVIKKDALHSEGKINYSNSFEMTREGILERLVAETKNDIIVSNTGKASREIYEIRERNGQGHQYDFLTVGSMGHCSSIALGIALHKPSSKVWCVDGDGGLLMHLGALAVIGASKPDNLKYVVINNEAHESVGGMPTVAQHINIPQIALGCGFSEAISVKTYDELEKALHDAKKADKLILIEAKAVIRARSDLGRPQTTPKQNKEEFMRYLKEYK